MLRTWESATTRGVFLRFSPGYNLRIPATFRYQTHLISSSTTGGGINVRWSNEEIEFTRDNCEKAAISFCSDQLQSSTIQQSCHDPPAPSRLHLPRTIHACVNAAFPVLVSILGRFVSDRRRFKLVNIRSEDVLLPLRGGLYAKARRSLSFESPFRIIHCLTLLSLLLLPSPVLPNQNPAP